MTAEEYKATRERMGMTQSALAVALNVTRKAINKRENGDPITQEAAMALEFLALKNPTMQRKFIHTLDTLGWVVDTLKQLEQTAVVRCMIDEVNRRMKTTRRKGTNA